MKTKIVFALFLVSFLSFAHDSVDRRGVSQGASDSRYVNTAGDTMTGALTGIQLYQSNGQAALPTYSFTDDKNTGAYRCSDDTYCISAGGALRQSIAAALNTHFTATDFRENINLFNGKKISFLDDALAEQASLLWGAGADPFFDFRITAGAHSGKGIYYDSTGVYSYNLPHVIAAATPYTPKDIEFLQFGSPAAAFFGRNALGTAFGLFPTTTRETSADSLAYISASSLWSLRGLFQHLVSVSSADVNTRDFPTTYTPSAALAVRQEAARYSLVLSGRNGLIADTLRMPFYMETDTGESVIFGAFDVRVAKAVNASYGGAVDILAPSNGNAAQVIASFGDDGAGSPRIDLRGAGGNNDVQAPTPISAGQVTTKGYVDARVAVVSTGIRIVPGDYGVAHNTQGNVGPSSTANTLLVFEFTLNERKTFTQFTIKQGAAGGAGKIAKLAIYTGAGALVIGSESLAADGTNVAKSVAATASTTLAPGIYYVAYVTDEATTTWRVNGVEIASGFGDGINLNAVRVGTAANLMSGGTLPATLGTLTRITAGASIFVPMIILE